MAAHFLERWADSLAREGVISEEAALFGGREEIMLKYHFLHTAGHLV